MLLAIVALATSPDPGIYGGFELQSGPYPLRLDVYAERPLTASGAIRIQPSTLRANGRKRSFHFEAAPGSNLKMAKGATKHSVSMRIVPPPNGEWLDGTLRLCVGNARPFPSGLNRYFPPTDPGDLELQRIRKRYVGKNVWIHGGDVRTTFRFSKYDYGVETYTYHTGLRPLKVIDVVRDHVPAGTPESYGTIRPLVVKFAPAPHGQIGLRDEQQHLSGLYKPPKGKQELIYLTVATGLILSEHLSLTPPPASLRRNLAKSEAAMREFDLSAARTKTDFLWLFGHPEVPKPWLSVFRQNDWSYSIAAPFSHALTFRRGKLVAKTLEGQLP